MGGELAAPGSNTARVNIWYGPQ